MKKFICVSPLQKPREGIYETANNDLLKYDKSTSFPIVPVINAYAEEGEEITVIVVVTDDKIPKENYEIIKSVLDEIVAEKKLKITYKPVYVANDSSLEVQLGVFSDIISLISDGDKIYCDITYGPKVQNQILTMSVNYGYRVRKDVMVGCMVYGAMDFVTGKMTIFDITSLTYLDEIVRLMAEKGVVDPTDAIKMLMNWEDEDD